MGTNGRNRVRFGGGSNNIVYQHGTTADRFEYLDERINQKQNKLALGSNTIENLDDMWEGVTWYNANQNPEGVMPYADYGYILSLRASNYPGFQLAIPYGEKSPKFRIFTNGKWYDWKPIANHNVSFNLTPNSAYSVNLLVQNCFCNLATGHVHIFFFANSISGAKGTGASIASVPEGYRPKTSKTGVAGITLTSESLPALYYGTVYPNGSIGQNRSTIEFKQMMFSVDYYI